MVVQTFGQGFFIIMKLEIKHLEPYLLHGVKFQESETKKVFEFNGIVDNIFYLFHKDFCKAKPNYLKTGRGNIESGSFKPILQTLSSLFNDDEMNLQTDQYWIIEKLRKVSDGCLAEDEWIDHMADFGSPNKIIEVDFQQCPYRLFQYLLSKHVDLFDLIDANLAVDINTIKQS